MSRPPTVFVTAPARSGTTFLSHMLAGRLDLACSPETNVFGILHRVTRGNPGMTFAEFEARQLEFLMHGRNRPYCALVARFLRDERIVDHPRAFAEWIIGLDSYSDGASVLEQTPRNGEHLRTLRWLFPESVIVFLLRNPFDVMQSNRATPWGTGNLMVLFAIFSRQYCELVRLCRSYGSRRVIAVRYEKLQHDGYREALIAKLMKAGISQRRATILIEPRNFAGNEWAGEHMSQSVGQFKSRSAGKWTGKFPVLRRLGEGILLDTMRAARGRRGSTWRMWIVGIADRFARRRIAR